MDKKKQIEELYTDALYNDEAPNVFADRILSLFSVSPRYSISLVYVKNIPKGQEIDLRSFITDANSKEEALGKALIYFTDEMKNYNLSNKVVIKLNEG